MTDDPLGGVGGTGGALGGDGGRRYRLRRLIGAGGFGKVYQAELTADGGFTRDVAIKILDPARFSGDEPLRRLRDEARVLGLIRHRSVVGIHALSRLTPGWAIIMEYVEGVDIGRIVAHGGLPPRAALAVVEEVASLLRCAWDQPAGEGGAPLRLIHRDIKPSNLRLTPDGALKVLDFGTAKADIANREGQSEELLLGSVKFMAPERFRGQDGPPGDIYALGLVLGELLVGRPVAATVPGEAEHRRLVHDLLAAVSEALGRAEPVLHPSQIKSTLDLLGGMLAFLPDDRLRVDTVEQWSQRLWTQLPGPTLREWARREVRGLMEVQARRLGADALTGSVLVEGRPSPRTSRGPWIVLAAVVLVGVVGAVGLAGAGTLGWLFWWKQSDAPVVTPPPAPVSELGEPADEAPAEPEAAPPAEVAAASTGRVSPARSESSPAPALPPRTPTVPETRPEVSPTVASAVVVPASEPKVAAPVSSPAAPTPASPSLPETGRVQVTGDAERVVLEQEGAQLQPGNVPAGAYRVLADFGDGALSYAGKVTVVAGTTIKLRCAAGFRECRPG